MGQNYLVRGFDVISRKAKPITHGAFRTKKHRLTTADVI